MATVVEIIKDINSGKTEIEMSIQTLNDFINECVKHKLDCNINIRIDSKTQKAFLTKDKNFMRIT